MGNCFGNSAEEDVPSSPGFKTLNSGTVTRDLGGTSAVGSFSKKAEDVSSPAAVSELSDAE